jgi:hypothetical protein
MPDEDIKDKDASRQTVSKTADEEKGVSLRDKIMDRLVVHGLPFLVGALLGGLWTKLVFFRRFEVEWGMDHFRGPVMLIVMTFFFFLLGVGLVYGVRHVLIWIKGCRTYE